MLSRSMVALVIPTLLLATLQPAGAQQLTACPAPNCASLTAVGGTLQANKTIDIPISFAQAPTDGQGSSGNDDVAAIAFTLGLGVEDSPLALSVCTDGDSDGLPDAVKPAAAISGFRVVVENAFCTNRNRCLCPDGTQTRDNFINVVVYGPKDLPATGPVTIPKLPNSGQLMTITLKRAESGDLRTETLRIFAETDLTNPKPTFGAYLSIGDQGAVDQTANRGTNVSKVNVNTADVVIEKSTVTVGCVGDCDNSHAVAVNELVTGVNIALDRADLSACPSFDEDSSGSVGVNELVKGVNNALHGCP